MKKINREDLMSLEKYSEIRDDFRRQMIAHKKDRVVRVGPNMSLHFEDRILMQYQIQEMLRAEKIFDVAGIQEELDTYNPLIPDGSNLKATFMIEYEDPEERAKALKELLGVECKVWLQVEGFNKVLPIADEDLNRATEEKTSAVHFLRFEFDKQMIQAAKKGKMISLGVDHPYYHHSLEPLAQKHSISLIADFD
ncbi:MAG: DUF3501 family protein [Gammaproteobacteria bacterium]|nr:DUF3501 family protein [Gammaproteobacteria bacterium]